MNGNPSTEAAATINKWKIFCLENAGEANKFMVGETSYFFKIKTIHEDGSITGEIGKYLPRTIRDELMNTVSSKKTTWFKINADGSVKRAPKILRDIK
jgi:hypothetical protein